MLALKPFARTRDGLAPYGSGPIAIYDLDGLPGGQKVRIANVRGSAHEPLWQIKVVGKPRRRITDDTFVTPEDALKEVERRQNPERLRILNYCEALNQLLDSMKDTTSVVPHLQMLCELRRKAEQYPQEKFDELWQEMKDLILHWKSLPAGDGEPIISAHRHEQFLATLIDL
jgi:hypothetical protein